MSDAVVMILFWTVVLGAVGVPAYIAYKKGPAGPTHVCSRCHSMMRPIDKKPGSGFMTILLLFFFLVPGILYAIWRSAMTHPVCPWCGEPKPIQLGAPGPALVKSR